MSAFERMCLFRAEVAEPQAIAWPGCSHGEAQGAPWRAAGEDELQHAAELLDEAPGAAAAALHNALWRCVEARRLQWQLAPDPEEDALAAIERYAPLLALRVHAALSASDAHDRLRGCLEVFRAVFGTEPRGLASHDDYLAAGSAHPEPGASAIRS